MLIQYLDMTRIQPFKVCRPLVARNHIWNDGVMLRDGSIQCKGAILHLIYVNGFQCKRGENMQKAVSAMQGLILGEMQLSLMLPEVDFLHSNMCKRAEWGKHCV